MRVAFRVDASVEIGTGHVMRCLTLADALRVRGHECHFICREHPGHLIEQIRNKGYPVAPLPFEGSLDYGVGQVEKLAHQHWLGASWEEDAHRCRALLDPIQPDWLIVDHYALDARWELVLKPCYDQLMVIDDLADRRHECALLLDQTYGQNPEPYRALVPAGCDLLVGANYALLRPEFAELRNYSLARRSSPQLKNILITMGGVDKDNITSEVLESLRISPLTEECSINIVMGATAPWLNSVIKQAAESPLKVTVRAGVSNMAQLMAESDLAIGAAGSTSWERCCLGLPTLMLVLAKNQEHAAQLLEQAGSAVQVMRSSLGKELPRLIRQLYTSPAQLLEMSCNAKRITDGTGTLQVVAELENTGFGK